MKEENLRKKVRYKGILCACLLALCVGLAVFAANISVAENFSVTAECTTIRAAAAVII